MTDDKVKADVHFITAALSWYDGTEAAADVREAWARLQAERDKLSGEVDGWKAQYDKATARTAQYAREAISSEAKLTALVEALMNSAVGLEYMAANRGGKLAREFKDQAAKNRALIAAFQSRQEEKWP